MKKQFINWQDGMKINETHFQGMEDALRLEVINASAIRLNSFNYGLLPPAGGDAPFDIFIKLDQSGDLVLTLQSCTAILPGGAYVCVQPGQQFLKEHRIDRANIEAKMKSSNANELFVTLSTNVFNREKTGEPLPHEHPIRKPYVVSSKLLELKHLDEVSHNNHGGNFELIVARVVLESDVILQDTNYIPPCASVNAHDKLSKVVDNWQQSLGSTLLSNVQKAIRNIESRELLTKDSSKDKLGHQHSPAAAAYEVSKNILMVLADILPYFSLRKEQSFYHTFSDLQRISGNMWSTLECVSLDKKEALQNYLTEALTEQNDISPMLRAFTEFKYEHDRIDKAVKAGQNFLNRLLALYHINEGLPAKDFSWNTIKTDIFEIIEKENKNTL